MGSCRHGPPLSRPPTGDADRAELRREGREHGELWISGGTVLYEGDREVARRVDVGPAVVHQGGVRFPISGPLHHTITAEQAAAFCGLVGPRTILPAHYEGRTHVRQGRDAAERAFAEAPGGIAARVPQPRDGARRSVGDHLYCMDAMRLRPPDPVPAPASHGSPPPVAHPVSHERTVPSPSKRDKRGLTAALLIGAVALASCGTSAAAKHAPPTTTAPAPTTTAVPILAPLTGLPVASAAVVARPAVIVKIDNASAAWPQSGIDQADVVYEEVVEGGTTRYLAVFQSQEANPVGPVRSVRETDADIVRPIGGLFGYSGGIPYFVNLIDRSGITDVGADADGGAYYRSNYRAAPHNLYTSTTVLRQRTPAGAGPPPALFDYAGTQGFSEPGEQPVSRVVVPMSGATVATWSYDATIRLWDRSTNGVPQTAAVGTSLRPGPPVAFTNVIVETVPYVNTGFVDPAGNPVPDADTVGTGTAVVLSTGELVHATWSKPTASSITTYQASDGSPIRLLPGTTWVMLAPTKAAITSS